VDPRLASRLTLGTSTTLKGGVGYYSQPPQIWEAMPAFGNPDVEAFRTLQTSAGVEQVLGEHVRTDVDVFYKHWGNRIVSTPGGAPPRYVNRGTGDAYGAEFLVDISVAERNQTYVSYTLSRSTRKDTGQPTRLFDRDQTHNLSLATNYDFGHGFSAGARFRYVTGNPYTAPRASVYDAATDTYRPLYAGINQERHDAFHQLDVRVEKLWKVGPVGLTAYLEVMNVYNAENQEGRRYSFDYRESASVAGMPFFPNVGIRGEL
jgi:outer membrane receptor for ferrienterochelin and colicin